MRHGEGEGRGAGAGRTVACVTSRCISFWAANSVRQGGRDGGGQDTRGGQGQPAVKSVVGISSTSRRSGFLGGRGANLVFYCECVCCCRNGTTNSCEAARTHHIKSTFLHRSQERGQNKLTAPSSRNLSDQKDSQ